jgi:hypothetical protein
MQKLLDAYREDPTEKNRTKLVKYMGKYTFAICLVSPRDVAFLKRHHLV